MWYSLFILDYKSTQHVTVQNTRLNQACENDEMKRCGNKMYESDASITWHTVLQQMFF